MSEALNLPFDGNGLAQTDDRCFFCASSALQRKRNPANAGCMVCNPQRGASVTDFRDLLEDEQREIQEGLYRRLFDDMRRYGPTARQRAKGLLTVQDLEKKYGRVAV